MDRAIARRIVVLALIVGLAVDLLLDGFALGLNVLIVVSALVIAIPLVRPPATRVDSADLWLPVVAILAGAGPVLRTDSVIVFLDVVIATVAVGAWSVAASGRPVTRSSTLAVIELGIRTVAALGVGAPSGARGALPEDSGAVARTRLGSSLPVVRGLLLALPVLAVFTALLISADEVFAAYVDDLFTLPFDLGDLVRRGLIVASVGWIAAGLLAVAAARFDVAPEIATGESAATLDDPAARRGATEALTILVAVEVLFAAFVVSQATYLFGGHTALDAQGGVYSGYAREGYFQLVAVVSLAGLLVVAVEWLSGANRRFVVAALGFIGLTFVILASAGLRLALYLQAYGWTELRFYVAASVAWLAAGGAILAVLVARKRMAWLWHGLAISAVAITLVISAIGPQAFIARQNLARALDPSLVPFDGHPGVDTAYLTYFSDDAIPDIVRAYPRLDPDNQAFLYWFLVARKEELAADPSTRGWPAWNLAREQARRALATLDLDEPPTGPTGSEPYTGRDAAAVRTPPRADAREGRRRPA